MTANTWLWIAFWLAVGSALLFAFFWLVTLAEFRGLRRNYLRARKERDACWDGEDDEEYTVPDFDPVTHPFERAMVNRQTPYLKMIQNQPIGKTSQWGYLAPTERPHPFGPWVGLGGDICPCPSCSPKNLLND